MTNESEYLITNDQKQANPHKSWRKIANSHVARIGLMVAAATGGILLSHDNNQPKRLNIQTHNANNILHLDAFSLDELRSPGFDISHLRKDNDADEQNTDDFDTEPPPPANWHPKNYFQEFLVKELTSLQDNRKAGQSPNSILYDSIRLPGFKMGETTIDIIEGKQKYLIMGGNIGGLEGDTLTEANRLVRLPLDDNYQVSSFVAENIQPIPEDLWPKQLRRFSDVNFLPRGNGKYLVSGLAIDPDKIMSACQGQYAQWFITEVDAITNKDPRLLFTSNPDNSCNRIMYDKPAIAATEDGGFLAVAVEQGKKGVAQMAVYKTANEQTAHVAEIPELTDASGRILSRLSPAVTYIGNDKYILFNSGALKEDDVSLKGIFYRTFDAKTGTYTPEQQVLFENGENPFINAFKITGLNYNRLGNAIEAGNTAEYAIAVQSTTQNETQDVKNIKASHLETIVMTVNNKTGKTTASQLPTPLLNPSVQVIKEGNTSQVYIVGHANYSEEDKGDITMGHFENAALQIDPKTGQVLADYRFQKFDLPITAADPDFPERHWSSRTTDYANQKLIKVNGQLQMISYQSSPIYYDEEDSILTVASHYPKAFTFEK